MLKFLKHFSLYSLVGFLNPAINFFLAPLLSHYLLPADYGLLSLFTTYIAIIVPLISLVAYAMLSVEYYKEKDPSVFASKFLSIQLIPFVNFLWMGLLAWGLFNHYAGAIELNSVNRIWILAVLLISLSTVYIETLFTFLVIQRKVVLYTVYSLVRLFLETGLTVWLIVYNGWGWDGRIMSALIVALLFLIISIVYFRQQGYLKGRIKFEFIREGIIYGLPLILHSAGKVVMNQSDRLFITKMVSLDEAGIYNIGYTVGMVILIVVNVFSNLLTPFVYERLANLSEQGKVQIVKFSYLFAGGTLLVLLLMVPISNFLFDYLIDPNYSEGRRFVFWIGLSYFLWGCYLLFSGYIFYYNKTALLAKLAVLSIVCNVIFNYFLIGRFGAMGAAYSTTLSFFIVFIIVAVQANKLVKLPWFQKHTFRLKS